MHGVADGVEVEDVDHIGLAPPPPAGPAAPAPAAAPTVPPGWLPDPGAHELRYWDGSVWTEHVSDGGLQAVDPL
jgi:hypothetical protein